MSKRKSRRRETIYSLELDEVSRHALCAVLDYLSFTRNPSDADLQLSAALSTRIEPLIPVPGFLELSFQKSELKVIVRCLELSLLYLGGEDVIHPLSDFADTVLPGELSTLAPAIRVLYSALSSLLADAGQPVR